MATIQDVVKEKLVGYEEDIPISEQVRSDFLRNAQTDQDTGDLYMDEDGFTAAIAPEGEDYVCYPVQIIAAIVH